MERAASGRRQAAAPLRAGQEAYQRRCGTNLHLLHDATAMDLDGFLGRAQLGSDLLVEHAGRDQLEHLSLARGEAREATNELLVFTMLGTTFRVPEDRLLHRGHQLCAVHWLRQEAHRARLHRLHGGGNVALTGDKDDSPIAATLEQCALQLETAHLRHAQVGDQAAGSLCIVRLEKLRGRSPGAHDETARLQHASQGEDHCLVVIQQEDDWLRLRHDQFPSSLVPPKCHERVPMLLFSGARAELIMPFGECASPAQANSLARAQARLRQQPTPFRLRGSQEAERSLTASLMRSTRRSRCSGFDRYATAPSARHCSRSAGWSCAVTTMIGRWICPRDSWRCTSRPLSPGIW